MRALILAALCAFSSAVCGTLAIACLHLGQPGLAGVDAVLAIVCGAVALANLMTATRP